MAARKWFDYNKAKALYLSGMSTRDCAAYFGISKSAMWLGLQRIGVQTRLRTRYGKENNLYRGGSRSNQTIINFVQKAIRLGVLIPQACEVCSVVKTQRNGKRAIEAHHDDYNFPLQVRWLCRKHHQEWHKHNKAIPLKSS